jgi:UDP-glucuronate 4-epimerase
VQHLVYASSSSVYGANQKTPFSVTDPVDHPVSLYAATKRANELMAHAYSHLYQVPSTGLRFFTVYGPWGRPDMAIFKFTQSILAGSPINVYNNGQMQRDFTYIDDVVEGILCVLQKPPTTATGNNGAPHKIYNLGNHQPVELLDLIELLEQSLGKRARKNFLPMQPGDVPVTFADVSDLLKDVGFRPQTPIEVGVQRFVDWYLQYHQAHQP